MFHNAYDSEGSSRPSLSGQLTDRPIQRGRNLFRKQGFELASTYHPSLPVGSDFLIIIYNKDKLDNHCIMQ